MLLKIKQRVLKKQALKKLTLFYNKYMLVYFLWQTSPHYRTMLQVCLPNRQHFLRVNTSESDKTTSTGLVLAISHINLKYYKRSFKSNTGHILYLQKIYQESLKYLYLYYSTNFNMRQWLFFQKFWTLVIPCIFIIQHRKSYNTYYRPIKRLKKKILHLISKN